jgi:hypothetical protein
MECLQVQPRDLVLINNYSEARPLVSARARNYLLLPVAAVIAIAIGYAISHNPSITGASVAAFLLVAALISAGPTRATAMLLATLPFLTMLDTLIPKLTLTFCAAASTLLLLIITRRYSFTGALSLSPVFFLLIVLAHAAGAETGEQFIEAAKYVLFPLVAIVVASDAGHARLVAMRPILLIGGIAAMAAQGVIVLLHLGHVGTKYGAGEQLGFATQNPHELALVGTTVAIGCLVSIRDIRWRMAATVVAVTPALATGVRSALVGVTAALLVLAFRAKFRPSVIVGMMLICGVIIFSGVGTIIVTRYEQDQAKGEFSTVTTAGSGRGGLWTTVLSSWSESGTPHLVFGQGFRSVEKIEEHNLDRRLFIAQSDLIAIIVELGILGLVAWLLTWISIFRSQIEWVILIPLIAYALLNGSIEYVGATVFSLALASACTPQTRTAVASRARSRVRRVYRMSSIGPPI